MTRFDDTSREPQDGPAWLSLVPAKVRDLVAANLPPNLIAGLRDRIPEPRPSRARPAAPRTAGQFLACSFEGPAGARPYKLYVPASYAGRPVPLVVMLHGCTQSPDDFAAGTGMNTAAERDTFLVAYPGQTSAANAQRCWNWFQPGDQRRGAGEPAIIAGITRQVMAEYAVDAARVYVAGLSAGGAAAAIMGQAYPELYAAVGVHSGLPCGAARDMSSAFAAMRQAAPARPADRSIPTIIFHGDRDTTVHASNADAIARQNEPAGQGRIQTRTGTSGRPYECIIDSDEQGRVVTERWLIHGAGHAWSGGLAAGSYTDPNGPDATAEMLRFFRQHPK